MSGFGGIHLLERDLWRLVRWTLLLGAIGGAVTLYLIG